MSNPSTTSSPNVSKRTRSRRIALAAIGTVAIAGAASLAVNAGPASGHGWDAVAVLRDVNGVKVGKVRFEGDSRGTVVKLSVNNIAVGRNAFHGLHLHANDAKAVCDPVTGGAFTNVGPHWNPSGVTHGSHHGDLPSLLVLGDGSATARVVTGRFNPSDIEGRAVILHAGPDNFANIPSRYVTGDPAVAGPDGTTNGTGDAGGRAACGIVTLD